MRYFKNLFFLILSYISNLLFNFLFLKILTNFLSPFYCGIYFSYIGAFLIISQISLLGVPYVFTRYIPFWEEKGEEEKIFSLFFLFSFLYLLIFFILLLFLIIFPFKEKEIFILSILASFSFSFLTLFSSLFNSFRKMEYSFLINFFYFLFLNLLLFLFRKKLDVEKVFLTQIFSSFISIFLSFLLIFSHKKFLSTSLNFKIIKEIKSYWKESFLLHFLSPIFDYSDRVLLAFFKSFIDVSIFVSARKIVTPLRQVLQYPQEAMAPEISARIKNFDEIKVYFEILRKILFLISIHLFFIIIVFGKFFILIITNEFYLKAYPVLLILTARIIISSLYSPYLLFYRSYGRMIHFFYSDLLWIISFLLLSYPFIKYFGITGLAFLNLFSTFLVLLFNYFFIFPKYEMISKKEFLKIFKFSISSFLPFSILILKKFLPPILILTIYYFLFIILSLIFKPLEKEEWKLFLKKIKKQ